MGRHAEFIGRCESLGSPIHNMQAGAVLFLSFFHRKNPAAKVSQLREFLPDSFQPFMPLAVSDLCRRFMVRLTPILVIQFLNVSDLNAEARNFFTKHCEMIHDIRITHSQDCAQMERASTDCNCQADFFVRKENLITLPRICGGIHSARFEKFDGM
jgi:hypothetical protein